MFSFAATYGTGAGVVTTNPRLQSASVAKIPRLHHSLILALEAGSKQEHCLSLYMGVATDVDKGLSILHLNVGRSHVRALSQWNLICS